MGNRIRFISLSMGFAALLVGCSGRSPVGPSNSKAASGVQTDIRVQDVGSGGSESPCDPTDNCLEVTVTLSGSNTDLTATCFASLQQGNLVMNRCDGFVSTGNYAWPTDLYADPSTGAVVDLSSSFVLTPTTLTASLWLLHSPNQAFLSEGQLSASVITLLPIVGCTPGVQLVEATYSGSLSHLGNVQGTISGVCPLG